MTHLPINAPDEDLIAFADRWAALMELEEYEAAYKFTKQDPQMQWTPTLMREVIKSYGDANPTQIVTVLGEPTDVRQRKRVDRWPKNVRDAIGEIWYDLNIDGLASDLTATFQILDRNKGLEIELNDIHVM